MLLLILLPLYAVIYPQSYLNTSHVAVNQFSGFNPIFQLRYLNTSHVAVNLYLLTFQHPPQHHLNTSHVAVNHKRI